MSRSNILHNVFALPGWPDILIVKSEQAICLPGRGLAHFPATGDFGTLAGRSVASKQRRYAKRSLISSRWQQHRARRLAVRPGSTPLPLQSTSGPPLPNVDLRPPSQLHRWLPP